MVMMEIVQGVCIFCTENDSVLSDDNKIDFLKIIKINFFSNNRFNFSEFSKLFNKLSICLLCAYKVQCCSNIRDTFKKGDANKSKRNQDKCCSLCHKTDNVTTGTAELKKEANQFAKDIKKGSNINIKYICLSCTFAVSVWDSIVTAIWNLLNDESADSEKENVAKTNARNKNKNIDTTETENKMETTRSKRLRTRPATENDNKSKSENSAKVNNKSDKSTSRNVGKRQRETVPDEPVQEEKTKTTRKRSIGDSHDDVTPKKRRISARVNSESESIPEENLKRTRRKHETTRHSTEESVSESTPVQTKKSRQSEDVTTPKIQRSSTIGRINSVKKNKRISTHYSNGILDKKLKHLNTVNRETRKKNMHLSYSAVTDQRIMFEIPYISCTPHDVDPFIAKKMKTTSSVANESSNEKTMDTKKGSKNKNKAKHSTPSNETTPKEAIKRQTRSKKTNQEKETIVIDISSTDDEAKGEISSPSYRRSGRIRKPTPKIVIKSKKEKLSTSIKKATKIQFKCTECNEYFPTLHKMSLHKEKHHRPSSPTSELSDQNSEDMETNEDTDRNTEENNTETEEESDKRENVRSADIGEKNAGSSEEDNSNINGETNKTDEDTEEETKNNEETNMEDEDIEKSRKELDIDENVTEEISETQSNDKNEAEVETITEENDTVEITDKQADDDNSTNNDNIDINTADNIEEKDNDEMNDKGTNNTDDTSEETEDNKPTGNDENSNDKSDTETVILIENNIEQITNDIIEDICEFTDVTETDIHDSEETSVDDKALEENANTKESTEENVDLVQSNNIVQDENESTEKLNNEQNEENQEDDSEKPEEKDKIQKETSIAVKESISEISPPATSLKDDEICQKNLNDVIEITEDESSQTTSTCSESVIANDQEKAIIADNKNVPTEDISSLPEDDSEMETLKISSQTSSGSTINSVGKTETETTVTDEASQKSNGVITTENNFLQKDSIEDFAIVEDILENMGA